MTSACILLSCIVFFLSLVALCIPTCGSTILPPLPLLPLPSSAQLQWQRREFIMFFHFGINTFTNSEWGSGHEPPHLFSPSHLDTKQWIRVAKAAGASLVIFTAKHHDGFCLWPSAFTNYSVKSSHWKHGHGDVVGELAKAAQEEGVDLGLYLSPWDRHDHRYGQEVGYNEYYMAQLHEILTRYGSISEIWFDGAKGPNAPKMTYMFKNWFALTHELQSKINIFSDAGPDVRWVGDENGTSGLTSWSMMNKSDAKIGAGANLQILNMGDPHGRDWVPPECDVSIRPGWFWHKHERPKTLLQLLDLYYRSVGRNCVLLLNVPPNSTGVIGAEDEEAVRQFRETRNAIFGADFARKWTKARASSFRGEGYEAWKIVDGQQDTYWAPQEGTKYGTIIIVLSEETTFNIVGLKEATWLGQRVEVYETRVRVRVMEHHHHGTKKGWAWRKFSSGTTIGYQKLDRGCNVTTSHIQLVIKKARADPLISSLSLYLDHTSPPLSSCSPPS